MTLLKLMRLSFRNLLRNKRRSFITLCIAATGFAAIALGAGYVDFTFYGLKELTIRNGFTGTGGTGHLQILNEKALKTDESYPLEFGISDYEAIIAMIDDLPEISFAMPRIEFSGLISNGEKSISFLGQGVDAEREAQLLQVFTEVKSIKLNNTAFYALQKSRNGVLLGQRMAKSLNVRVGSDLMLLSATVDGAINAIDVTVAGIISTGLKEADRYYLLADISTAQRLIHTERVSKIVVVLKDTKTAPVAASKVSNILMERSPSLLFGIQRWDELAEYYYSIHDLYRIIFSFMGGIVVVIVILSCTNTMLMATMERIGEIGTLMAIGISYKWIMGIFLIEGFLIGLGGVVLGFILEYSLSSIITYAGFMMPPPPGMTVSYRLEVYPITIVLPWDAIIIVFSTVLSSAVTFWKVKKISIVEALRHV